METSDKEKHLLYKLVLNLSLNLVLNVIQDSCDKFHKNTIQILNATDIILQILQAFNRSLHAYIIKNGIFSFFKFLTCVGENEINKNYQKLFRFYNGTN